MSLIWNCTLGHTLIMCFKVISCVQIYFYTAQRSTWLISSQRKVEEPLVHSLKRSAMSRGAKTGPVLQ